MLDRRIAQRTYQIIELGLVDEVTKLCDKYCPFTQEEFLDRDQRSWHCVIALLRNK